MRILLAEDEKELSNAVAMILKSQKYEVDAVFDGEEAVDYAQMVEYDLIIMDIMMPKMDGIEAVKRIRDLSLDTPIIFLTAKSQLDSKIEGFDIGGDDYLTKPFDMRELLARVKALLRRRPSYQSRKISIGDIVFDQDKATILKGDNFVQLNNKEFQLFELFVMNKTHILSTEMIMDRIWGLETDSEINVVWVNISSIRKKLSKIGSNVSIKSVRGIGYQLEYEEN